MWLLWRKANLAHKLPSEIFGERDPLAAWMLDNAVLTFGTIIENALLEQDEIGSGQGKQYVKRYKLAELLDPNFRLPRPQDEQLEELQTPAAGLMFDEV